VSLALFGAFITRVSVVMPASEALAIEGVNLLTPMVFATVLFGAMVPYWYVFYFFHVLNSRFFP
jgi:hypothetical protein